MNSFHSPPPGFPHPDPPPRPAHFRVLEFLTPASSPRRPPRMFACSPPSAPPSVPFYPQIVSSFSSVHFFFLNFCSYHADEGRGGSALPVLPFVKHHSFLGSIPVPPPCRSATVVSKYDFWFFPNRSWSHLLSSTPLPMFSDSSLLQTEFVGLPLLSLS